MTKIQISGLNVFGGEYILIMNYDGRWDDKSKGINNK